MSHQQTLKEPASCSGIGLHGGKKVTMTLLPAPANTGIRFRRVDLEGKPEVEARIENVVETSRSTTIGKGHVKVQTVEHVLSALAGLGVDNAIIELDDSEPPIMDGSSREFGRIIRRAGLAPQAEKREAFAVKEPIEIQVGESQMQIFPCDHFKLTCTSADRQGRHTQFYSLSLSPEAWERDLSHARTFCFYEEIEHLIKTGLIRGGSLENAVVIREDAVLTNEPLRYPEEFVRHKMLDIVGDLALFGRPILGHVVAIKPGHAANCEMARRIDTQMRKPAVQAQTFSAPPAEARTAPQSKADSKKVEVPDLSITLMDNVEVMKIIPHRYPFLMVDRVVKIEGSRIVAVKNVSANEWYFQGHFPGHPVMPGVLQLEAIAQVAGILMLKTLANLGKIAYFMSAEEVKWRSPVKPGETLVIDVDLTKCRGRLGKARGVCSVNGNVVSEAVVSFILADA